MAVAAPTPYTYATGSCRCPLEIVNPPSFCLHTPVHRSRAEPMPTSRLNIGPAKTAATAMDGSPCLAIATSAKRSPAEFPQASTVTPIRDSDSAGAWLGYSLAQKRKMKVEVCIDKRMYVMLYTYMYAHA